MALIGVCEPASIEWSADYPQADIVHKPPPIYPSFDAASEPQQSPLIGVQSYLVKAVVEKDIRKTILEGGEVDVMCVRPTAKENRVRSSVEEHLTIVEFVGHPESPVNVLCEDIGDALHANDRIRIGLSSELQHIAGNLDIASPGC